MKNKITIMKKSPITDEEIQSFMDFDRVLREAQSPKPTTGWSSVKWIAGVAGVGLMTYFILTLNSSDQKIDAPKANEIIADPNAGEPKVLDSLAESEIPVEEPAKAKSKAPSPDKKKTDVSRKEADKSFADTSETEPIQKPVYINAEPMDGYPALYAYFNKALKYPETIAGDSISGVVMVVFTVGVKGDIEKITIEQSLGAAFDAEAIRLVKEMPSWKPATYKGKPVASRLSLPVTFEKKNIHKPQ